ncbi:MAG: nicotinate-nucleotide adenylyltransferase [Bacteroidota bacterium]
MKIGIYGGTFNPPHMGHLIVAERVRTELALDSIIFIPTFISPHKQEGESGEPLDRLRMTKLAILDNEKFQALDFEINSKSVSYTVKTLEYLKRTKPDDTFYLLIGMDNYITFHLWKEPKKILEMATLVVMSRPGYPKQVNEVLGTQNTVFIDVPNIDISSSNIRDRVEQWKSVRYLVPEPVETYIHNKGLFKKINP